MALSAPRNVEIGTVIAPIAGYCWSQKGFDAHAWKSVAPNNALYSDGDKPATDQLPDDNDPLDDDVRFSLLEKPITDQVINAELNLSQGEKFRSANKVKEKVPRLGNQNLQR